VGITRTSIDVESLRQMLEQGEPVTVLDVRPEDQSSEWWIPGRVQFAAYRALKANDPDAMKEGSCRRGSRS
jgi:rhodanese-related sulfurtransferase